MARRPVTIRSRPLVIDNDYHDAGERLGVERHGLRQALAWQVAAELARRHPGDILVIETHPGGGQYDCVTVCVRAAGDDAEHPGGWRTVVQMNKATPHDHITHEGWFGGGEGERFNWVDVLLCPDLRAHVIEPLEQAERLPSPATTPSTTAGSIGVRLLAAFAGRVAFTRKRWVLLNGYLDSSGGGGGTREELFDALPALAEDRRIRRDDDLLGIPDYRYWFVAEGHPDGHARARLAVDVRQGIAYTTDGRVELMERYRALGRHVDALTSEVCPAGF